MFTLQNNPHHTPSRQDTFHAQQQYNKR
jgi:hypothetical protein